jgi:copper chaperone
MQFHIPAMACDGCVRSVTLALQALDPGAEVTADLTNRVIEVTSDAPRQTLAAALAEIGYAPTPAKDN